MASSIVDIKNMGDALRNTGYKNIESAVAEIIDNAEEANAKNAFVILGEHIDPSSGRKVIHEIGFLDDGSGMDTSTLGTCLGIGFTTRTGRRGLGRFGVGLPQASLYACPEVIVYSWQMESRIAREYSWILKKLNPVNRLKSLIRLMSRYPKNISNTFIIKLLRIPLIFPSQEL